MKTLVLEKNEALRMAADQILSLVKEKPDSVIAMAAGRTMAELWEFLEPGCFSQAFCFQVSEFAGVPYDKSLRRMMQEHLMPASALKSEHCFWLNAENWENCETALQKAGGIDLAVLGIGNNGHIGFNEPAAPFSSRTRIQKLTDKTRNQYTWLFGVENDVPEKAYTMGIRTLTEAKQIVLVACGAEKSEAVFNMVYARNDSTVPAAFLQLPANVTVYADSEAGQRL